MSKANEVLILGKRLDAEELLTCGFVKYVFAVQQFIAPRSIHNSKIFPQQDYKSFHAAVRACVLEQLEGLDPVAVLKSKELIQFGINEKNSKDAANLRESYAQAERFATGKPAERFGKIARKEIKHKL